jgi:hypothetical protein
MKDKAEKVRSLVMDCLNGKEEGALLVKGIVRTFCFSPEKIGAHREEIRDLLSDMPDSFQAEGGGGMSFLNLCEDRHGEQWTGLQQTMEELVALGEAAGMASYPMPRDMWSVLPGGMPYVVFNTKATATA